MYPEATAVPCHTPVPIVPTVTKLAALVIDACVPPVTVAAVPDVLPVTFPVTLPVTVLVSPVDVNIPVDGLYVNPVSVSIPCVPVAPSTKAGYTVSSVLLFAEAVILVANVAVPVVF